MRSATFRAKHPKLTGKPIMIRVCVALFFVALIGLIVTAIMSVSRYTIVMLVFLALSVLFCIWCGFSLVFVAWEDDVVVKFGKDNMTLRYKDLMSNSNVKYKFLRLDKFQYVGDNLSITGKTDLAQDITVKVKCVFDDKTELIEMLNEFKEA